MIINIPKNLEQQVLALVRKEKKKQEERDVPYWHVIITGKQSKNGHENLDKIKFPTLVSYRQFWESRVGFITHKHDEKYTLWDCTKQWGVSNFQGEADTIKELWKMFEFKVKKEKIIGKRG